MIYTGKVAPTGINLKSEDKTSTVSPEDNSYSNGSGHKGTDAKEFAKRLIIIIIIQRKALIKKNVLLLNFFRIWEIKI